MDGSRLYEMSCSSLVELDGWLSTRDLDGEAGCPHSA